MKSSLVRPNVPSPDLYPPISEPKFGYPIDIAHVITSRIFIISNISNLKIIYPTENVVTYILYEV